MASYGNANFGHSAGWEIGAGNAPKSRRSSEMGAKPKTGDNDPRQIRDTPGDGSIMSEKVVIGSDGVARIERHGIQKFQLGDTFFEVDIFRFNNEVVALHQEHEAGSGEALPHLIELVKRWSGVSDVTGAEAFAVVDTVVAMANREKKDGTTPASSPATTDSTASDSPSGSST